MNDWLNRPWVIRVLSLILAVLIFIVVSFDNQENSSNEVGFDDLFSSSQETQIVEDIPVNIQIDDEQYVVSGVPQTASVTLAGTVSVVQSTATQQNFDVFVDLEDLEVGTYTVPLEHDGISDRLDVSIDPEEIEVTIEERASAEFEVIADYTNEDGLQAGYELLEASIEPSTVQITSSKSVVDQIAVVKAFVDVDGIGESLTIEEVPVRVYDSEGNELNVRIEPETVSVTVNVDNPNKNVPINIDTTGEAAEGIIISSTTSETEEVQVFASASDLDEIDEISTEPIDLSEITEDTTIEVELNVPDNARMLNPSTITVNVETDLELVETFENAPISVENLDNTYTASFIEPQGGEVDLSVTGFETDLEGVTVADFQLTLDASGLEPGEHEVPIDVIGPNNLDIVLSVDDAIISITSE
ncbi:MULTISPECIES: YbbR-like domain-containing protein [Paraliobacillus]|uniref:CdaR family protein n=1 Tax=Paraliobacillus TaxID=200903 RepID=UPI000DD3C604|nr:MULTISPECIES: CdaR family protein [Paraliobacillus]